MAVRDQSPEAIAREGLEWCEGFRDGLFEPAYYTKCWPVEMDGLVDAHEALCKAYLDLKWRMDGLEK